MSDPFKPVPFIENVDIGMTREYMTDDQRFASRRPDVLSYQTDVLAEDLTVAGPLQADLFVSTTGTDADFIVKLIDVHPDDAKDPDPNPTNFRTAGYQMLVRGEPFRARFRNGFDRPEPMNAGRRNEDRVQAARREPHVSEGTPGHAADPVHVVSAG